MLSSSFFGASHQRYSSSSSSDASSALSSFLADFAAAFLGVADSAFIFLGVAASAFIFFGGAFFAFFAAGGASEPNSFFTPLVFLAEDTPFDWRFLVFAKGSSSESSSFRALFLASLARIALASLLAACSMAAFLLASLAPSGWSSSDDSGRAGLVDRRRQPLGQGRYGLVVAVNLAVLGLVAFCLAPQSA